MRCSNARLTTADYCDGWLLRLVRLLLSIRFFLRTPGVGSRPHDRSFEQDNAVELGHGAGAFEEGGLLTRGDEGVAQVSPGGIGLQA
jgi:hypothetical protein